LRSATKTACRSSNPNPGYTKFCTPSAADLASVLAQSSTDERLGRSPSFDFYRFINDTCAPPTGIKNEPLRPYLASTDIIFSTCGAFFLMPQVSKMNHSYLTTYYRFSLALFHSSKRLKSTRDPTVRKFGRQFCWQEELANADLVLAHWWRLKHGQ
ncbi:hypothetical protein R0D68_31595, partial [Pseudomonas aeruginosa]|uniref:hypothetical protein n=2 Tax=Pseudomonas aeruginosa TaxID=287 RepID=UPI002935B7E4